MVLIVKSGVFVLIEVPDVPRVPEPDFNIIEVLPCKVNAPDCTLPVPPANNVILAAVVLAPIVMSLFAVVAILRPFVIFNAAADVETD